MLGKFGTLEACELDPCARALAGKRLGRPVQDAKLPDLTTIKMNSCDLIALLDVLEHVPDDSASLCAIYNRLKPGGALLLTVPANPWMWSGHDVAHHHFRRYNKADVERLARDAGFHVQLLSYFNTLHFPLIAAVRILGKAFGKEAADDKLPSAPVNKVLNAIFASEAGLIGRLPMPFGVSLVAVLRRPA